MISKWLSDISRVNEHFDKPASIFNEALKNNGFDETLEFPPAIPRRRRRGREFFLFNPKFSTSVKINVGKLFLTL